MKVNGNFFLPPPENDVDFKELLKWATDAGVGLPVDCHGNPIGMWTPQSLANAISAIEANRRGIDLRSVQHWFEDNGKGPGPENINWLARVFGCGDTDKTTEWRTAISASYRRLVLKRRSGRGAVAEGAVETSEHPDVGSVSEAGGRFGSQEATGTADRFKQGSRESNLSIQTEAVFGSQSSMALPLVVFTGACALALIAFTLNVHSVLLTFEGGHTKQVGFLWAPNWTIVFLAALPLFLALLIELLRCWKEEWRPELVALGEPSSPSASWERRLRAASYTFWATFLVTVIVASGYNWTATHLIPLLNGDTGSWPVDWGRIAIVRPELISVPSAIAFSGLVFLYNGFAAYFFFTGHILLHLMKHDYLDLAKRLENRLDNETGREFHRISLALMYGIYRCTALGVVITIMMKLQSSFLQSDSSNLVKWLVADFQSLFGTNNSNVLERVSFGIAPGLYYSFFCLLAIVGTFANASIKIRWMLARFDVAKSGNRFLSPWAIMDGSMALLVVSYFLIGALPGFSIFLLFSLVVTGYLLTKPASPWGQSSRQER